MLRAFIGRELRQRYVGSVLGRAWPFLQPTLILLIYYFVFVKLLNLAMVQEDSPEYRYLVGEIGERGAVAFSPLLMACGILPWLFSAEFIVRVTNTVVENGSLVKKIAFPSELLPIYLMGSYLVNLGIMMLIFTVLSIALTGIFPPMLWLFPIIVVLHAVYLLGLGYFLAAANIFIRDLKDLVPIFTNLWFFLTPIFYMKNMIPQENQWIYAINPMAYIIDLYRWSFIVPKPLRKEQVDGHWVDIGAADIATTLGIVAAFAVVFFFLGFKFFMANRHKFADEI